MERETVTIGQLARKAQVHVETVRYYHYPSARCHPLHVECKERCERAHAVRRHLRSAPFGSPACLPALPSRYAFAHLRLRNPR
jgi:hypothetical protein